MNAHRDLGTSGDDLDAGHEPLTTKEGWRRFVDAEIGRAHV